MKTRKHIAIEFPFFKRRKGYFQKLLCKLNILHEWERWSGRINYSEGFRIYNHYRRCIYCNKVEESQSFELTKRRYERQ